ANNKGNATVFFGYKLDEAVLQRDRDYSACTLGSNASGFTCSGSGTSYPGQFIDLTSGRVLSVANVPGGGPRPYPSAADAFNLGPYNYYQRPAERYTAAAFAHYDITPSARVYGEFMMHDDHTIAQIAPSGLFGVQTTVSSANPLLSAAWLGELGVTTPGA